MPRAKNAHCWSIRIPTAGNAAKTRPSAKRWFHLQCLCNLGENAAAAKIRPEGKPSSQAAPKGEDDVVAQPHFGQALHGAAATNPRLPSSDTHTHEASTSCLPVTVRRSPFAGRRLPLSKLILTQLASSIREAGWVQTLRQFGNSISARLPCFWQGSCDNFHATPSPCLLKTRRRLTL